MPSNPNNQLFSRAIKAQRQGRISEAELLYRNILQNHPGHPGACGNLATLYAKIGDLERAKSLFGRLIATSPRDARAHNNLGLVLLEQGRFEEAIASHREAIRLKSQYPEAAFNLGNALRGAGQHVAAEAAYRRALSFDPQNVKIRCNLALTLHALGKTVIAAVELQEFIRTKPGYYSAHFNLGVLLQSQGEWNGAVDAYREAARLLPHAVTYNNLGTVLQELGQHDQALDAFQQGVALAPTDPYLWFNIGSVLQQLTRLEEAISAYEKAVACKCDYPQAYNNLSLVFREQGRLDDAITMQRRALRIDDGSAESHNNLGALQLETGNLQEAVASIRQAIRLNPHYSEAYYNLGSAERELGNLQEALAAYELAVRLKPHWGEAVAQLFYHRLCACDWTDYKQTEQSMHEFVRVGARVPPFVLLAIRSTPQEMDRCARTWCAKITAPLISRPLATARPASARIRIGYISGDFRQHATATLAVGLFEGHDRSRFEIFGYSYGVNERSSMRNRLVRAFDSFADISSLSDHGAAQRIKSDDIDILVDLKGHTHGSRPRILAYRSAPVQVSYLGFPGTTGADFINYIIADRVVVPEEERVFYGEKVLYLEGCYQVNSPRIVAERRPSKTEVGLPKEAFVYCCFNNSFKISPMMFDVWMSILRKVPNSVLWLLDSNPLATRTLKLAASDRGISAERLVFAPRVEESEHLARHCLADVFLDTYPCNAHTTASDALWANVPVLTMAGETFAGRVAASLLITIGVPELVKSCVVDYEQSAVFLAQSKSAMMKLRAKLLENRRTLFDATNFARKLEVSFLRIHQAQSFPPPIDFR